MLRVLLSTSGNKKSLDVSGSRPDADPQNKKSMKDISSIRILCRKLNTVVEQKSTYKGKPSKDYQIGFFQSFLESIAINDQKAVSEIEKFLAQAEFCQENTKI
jgi:hypothetical protein